MISSEELCIVKRRFNTEKAGFIPKEGWPESSNRGSMSFFIHGNVCYATIQKLSNVVNSAVAVVRGGLQHIPYTQSTMPLSQAVIVMAGTSI